jgi:hypothetical protein
MCALFLILASMGCRADAFAQYNFYLPTSSGLELVMTAQADDFIHNLGDTLYNAEVFPDTTGSTLSWVSQANANAGSCTITTLIVGFDPEFNCTATSISFCTWATRGHRTFFLTRSGFTPPACS